MKRLLKRKGERVGRSLLCSLLGSCPATVVGLALWWGVGYASVELCLCLCSEVCSEVCSEGCYA